MSGVVGPYVKFYGTETACRVKNVVLCKSVPNIG